jgi:hemerythrin
MTYFVWKPDYSVGDATLDAQHQQLIQVMNELYELLHEPEAGQSDGRVEFIFGGLADYIVKHFAYEEQRMFDAGYPDDKLAAHRHEHNELVKHVRGYHAKVIEGDRDGLKELLPYLYGEWLIHHICQQDQEYMPYLQAKAV